MKKIWLLVALGLMLAACAPQASPPPPSLTEPASVAAPPSASTTPGPLTLWISPAVPVALQGIAKSWGVPIASDAAKATLNLGFHAGMEGNGSEWVYALVAPFPTV
ncbi:MAG: hypothetical protein ACXWNQ_03330 [Anaerolineales bacterium]